jgi:pyruvate,water dikinase
MTPPRFLGSVDGGEPPDTVMMAFFGGPPKPALEDGQLRGNPGSRGVTTGVAKVARTLEDAKALEPGEILVALTTMPAWTPLFGIAAAVVTETGGALSHCAVVAREYGNSAVVGAYGATTVIATGQRITVDGERGIVMLTV